MHKTSYVAIAGNIGSGKSSLTTLLAQNLQWKAFYEIVETNPYLQDFYGNMKRWSFHTQIFFLTKRFQHMQEILRLEESIVQDRSIFEDAEIFAKHLYMTGQMEERDYRTYVEHFQIMAPYLKVPDLIIYLRSDVDTLLNRIRSRGRNCEENLNREYIARLNEAYDTWVPSYKRGPIVTIDVSGKDFVNRHEDLAQVLSIVKWEVERVMNPSQAQLPFGWMAKAPSLRAGESIESVPPALAERMNSASQSLTSS